MENEENLSKFQTFSFKKYENTLRNDESLTKRDTVLAGFFVFKRSL